MATKGLGRRAVFTLFAIPPRTITAQSSIRRRKANAPAVVDWQSSEAIMSMDEPEFAKSIAAVIAEESASGAAAGWRSCTGCHETVEGYETGRYPYSKMLGCYVGSGCSECGGLGATWEYWPEGALAEMLQDTASDAIAKPEAAQPAHAQETIVTYYERQVRWSKETFGPGLRTKGIIDHIRKELQEVEDKPHDLSEWVDVIILAMDGFWRHGGSPAELMPRLLAKQRKNMARTWPDWRGQSQDHAIEHDRSSDVEGSQ